MAIQLDHRLVPSPDKVAAAKLFGGPLDVPWSVEADGHQWAMLRVSYARQTD